jgi:hypothetical protein
VVPDKQQKNEIYIMNGMCTEIAVRRYVNPKRCGLFGGVLFGEMKFFLSNFLSNEDLSISYESLDV